MTDQLRSDQGASLFMTAIALFLLMGAAAVAVDLSAIRLDRSADQKVTDIAASAGAVTVIDPALDGEDACISALDYVEANTAEIAPGSLSDSGCSVFAGACEPGDSYTLNSGDYTLTVTYPVVDTDPLMDSGQLGAPNQAVVPQDGEACDRVGVQMSSVRGSLFAQLLGFSSGTTTVHTVALGFLPSADAPPLNLLVLDRTGCDAIHVRGQGGVIVRPVIDTSTTPATEHAGVAAADSDASSGCTPSVLHAEGNALLRADGPPCPSQLPSGPGHGCGSIQSFVDPITPPCNPLACQINGSNATIAPLPPLAMSRRITRAQVDYEYNCWGDYTSPPGGVWSVPDLDPGTGQDIDGCPDAADPNIYELISNVGSSGASGLDTWAGPCNVVASSSASYSGGGLFVDCADFVVEGDVVIDGNVIFRGNVWVKSDGSLTINNSPGWAFFRDGYFRKDGQASLFIEQTTVYLSQNSWTEIAGGSNGELTWIAPDSGDFNDLALWSDSPHTHYWAGQSDLTMIGVFFTPWARADYSGTSGQNQTDAQWVAHSLEAHGQGLLEITPKFEFPVKPPEGARSTIIR